MKKRGIPALAAGCLLAAGALFAQGSAETKPAETKAKKPHAAMAAKPVMKSGDDLKWSEIPGSGGVKVADLWGDHAKGAYGALFKFPAGFMVPLHTHTHAMRIVVISGTFLQTPEGKEEMRLSAGSYLMQPGGNYRHTTGCDKASDCEVFGESAGAFDLKVVEPPKPVEKK